METPQTVHPDQVFAGLDAQWDHNLQSDVQEVQHHAGEVNGIPIILIKLEGGYDWHWHETVDELFLVLSGGLLMKLRDGDQKLGPGEFLIIPHGVEHSPNAVGDLHLLLVEAHGADVIYSAPPAAPTDRAIRVNMAEKLAQISDHWTPRVLGEINHLQAKIVKLQGEFDWHHHDAEDELFLVLKGRLTMRFRDRDETVGEGEFIIVPRGVEHLPSADDEVHLLLIEPGTTLNTGNLENGRTRRDLERL